jgi:hypothetical protein
MYLVIILGLTVVLPIASVLLELALSDAAFGLLLIGKWFVFWGVGVRLLLASIRQILQPSFTATAIFRIQDPAAEKLVTEIGFGNVSMGLVAALSLLFPHWLVPSGLTGGLYLGLAGLKHIANGERTGAETIAMVTNLLVAGIAGVTIIPAFLAHAGAA